MRCRACAYDNEAASRSCVACGVSFAPVCAHCGRDFPETARFCAWCGEPRKPDGPRGRRAGRAQAGDRAVRGHRRFNRADRRLWTPKGR